MSLLAYENGISHSHAKGRLKKCYAKLFFEQCRANNIRVYGDVAFLFNKDMLITVFQVPNNLKGLIKISKQNAPVAQLDSAVAF